MNHRLLTPAIVLVSFGAALGLTGPHVAPWRATAVEQQAVVVSSPSTRLQGHDAELPAMLPPQGMPPTPVVTPQTEPEPEEDTPIVVTPEAQAQESAGFLDARDRAAEHGARSH